MDKCKLCAKCCKKHWLIKLTNQRELDLFGDDVVFGNFIWADKCKYLKDNRCTIYEDRPLKCKQYFCENKII